MTDQSALAHTGSLAEDGLGVGKQGGGEACFHGVPNSVTTCS